MRYCFSMDQVRHIVKTVIPEVTEQDAEKLEERLTELGVRTHYDLLYVDETDITGCLKTVQTRILLDYIRQRNLRKCCSAECRQMFR